VAASKASEQREPRRSWPFSEKRRLVELTMRKGASLRAIAREHGLHPNSLYHWKALYRSGKLDTQGRPAARIAASLPSATFVPVSLVGSVRAARTFLPADANARCGSVVQLVLASGASMRIESGALDATLVCALVAELRR
jgi:transposase-like protein